jgi:hypothetical protein
VQYERSLLCLLVHSEAAEVCCHSPHQEPGQGAQDAIQNVLQQDVPVVLGTHVSGAQLQVAMRACVLGGGGEGFMVRLRGKWWTATAVASPW